MKVINNLTGEVSNATYAHNRLGNLRMWVNGKFYSDKTFDKIFSKLDTGTIEINDKREQTKN